MKITKFNNSEEVRVAAARFKTFVEGKEEGVWDREYKGIGRAFMEVNTFIGKSHYVWIECENNENNVVGLAYGWPENNTFYIQDIISAPKSGAGSAMVNWFANPANVSMPNLNKLVLSAANQQLIEIYKKPRYGFTVITGSNKMERVVPRSQESRDVLSYPSKASVTYPSDSPDSSRK